MLLLIFCWIEQEVSHTFQYFTNITEERDAEHLMVSGILYKHFQLNETKRYLMFCCSLKLNAK